MMAVKILRTRANLMEGEINLFLKKLGSQPGFRISIENVTLIHIGGKDDLDECMIMYNQIPVQQQEDQSTKR